MSDVVTAKYVILETITCSMASNIDALFCMNLPLHFVCFLSRCMAQKRQLLWQQGSHPYDALSLSRGTGRLPTGSAPG